MSDDIDIGTKSQILDLLYLRARGADRFDPDLMRACHPEDATDNHGTFAGRMYDFIATVERAQASGPPCLIKQHLVANALFKRRGEDVFVESYHVANETFVEDGVVQDYKIGGRYLDTFRRIDGRWLIQHRDIVYDWSRKIVGTEEASAIAGAPADVRGTRGPADPLYLLRPGARGALTPPTPRSTPVSDASSDLDRLLSKQAIAEVLYRRARAGDRGDAELAHTCYHPGATERHGLFDGTAAEFIDVVSFTKPKPGSPIKGMMHLITNVLCDFDSDDAAFVESYHVAYCQMTDGTDATIGGRYFDKFERRDGKWAIVHRDVIFDWSRVEPETEKFWDRHPAKPFLFGHRGENDPLYGYVPRGR